nr:hypothetical protein [Tanacetum cinerariifolium]
QSLFDENKACFKCGDFDHLAYDCDVWVEKGKNWSKNNFAHKNMTLIADLFKTASVSAARRVNTAAPRPNVNSARPKGTQDLMIIKLIQRVKRLERELKARTPPTKIQKVDGRIVGNKMLKSFPLPMMKFPLPEYFPTASEERIPLLSQRDAAAKEVCTAEKLKVNRGQRHIYISQRRVSVILGMCPMIVPII